MNKCDQVKCRIVVIILLSRLSVDIRSFANHHNSENENLHNILNKLTLKTSFVDIFDFQIHIIENLIHRQLN